MYIKYDYKQKSMENYVVTFHIINIKKYSLVLTDAARKSVHLLINQT